jgi:putative redox protein
MEFEGTADSGFRVNLASGGGEGLRPMELLLISLAGCTSIDVIGILQKQRQEVTGYQVQIEGKRAAEHPRVFTQIRVHYLVSGRGLDPAGLERAIELSKDKYCSVSAMLHHSANIEYTYEIVADGEFDEPDHFAHSLPVGRH